MIRGSAGDARVVILHLAGLTALDGTALNALEILLEKTRHHKKHLILSGLHTQRYILMKKSGVLDRVGADSSVSDKKFDRPYDPVLGARQGVSLLNHDHVRAYVTDV